MAAQRHRQPTKQLRLALRERYGWGGRRVRARRKRKPGFGRVPHIRRAFARLDVPFHITLRLRDGLPSLRTPWGRRVVHRAAVRMHVKGATLQHYAIQHNHLHLIIALERGAALHRALISFACVVAKAVNREAGERGSVFAGRYHARPLETPTELWNGMRYLLTQAAHHGLGVAPARDPFTSYAWCREHGRILKAGWLYRLLGMLDAERV